MINKLAKNWWLLLIAGFVYIALGFLVWQYPGETILFATVYIGIGLLISGLSMSVLAIGERDGISNWAGTSLPGLSMCFLEVCLYSIQ